MTWHTHLKTIQPKKINPIQINKKKKPTQIKINPPHPTQIKLTLKLNSNSLPLCNKLPHNVIFLLSLSPPPPLSHLSLSTFSLVSLSIFFLRGPKAIKKGQKREKDGSC